MEAISRQYGVVTDVKNKHKCLHTSNVFVSGENGYYCEG